MAGFPAVVRLRRQDGQSVTHLRLAARKTNTGNPSKKQNSGRKQKSGFSHPATRLREWREKEPRGERGKSAGVFFFAEHLHPAPRSKLTKRAARPVGAICTARAFSLRHTAAPKKGDAPATRLREWRERGSARVIAENGNGRAENVEREVRVAFFFLRHGG